MKFYCGLVLIFLFLSLHSKIQFGAKLGYNASQHYGIEEKDADYTVQSNVRHGRIAGLSANLPINEKLGLQYELNYTEKGSNEIIEIDLFDEKLPLDVQYETGYLEFPILFQYHLFSWEHFSVESVFGTCMAMLICSEYNLSGIWKDADGEVNLYAKEKNFDLDIFDFSLVYGGKISYHKYFLEYRFNLSWNELYFPTYAYIPVEDNDSILIDNPPVCLKNQTYSIMLGIVF